jgi:hypothetical protein
MPSRGVISKYGYARATRYEPIDPFFCWSFAALNLLAFGVEIDYEVFFQLSSMLRSRASLSLAPRHFSSRLTPTMNTTSTTDA